MASWILKKLNLLRVPPEVELEGLDVVEYHQDLYLPEVAVVSERIIEPDGTIVEADAIIAEAHSEVIRR